jgi:hypothetical protein
MNKKVKYILIGGLIFLLLGRTQLTGEVQKEYTQSTVWWQVELTIDVTGEYGNHTESSGFDGKYSFTASILGTLEEDEADDYIFFQVYQEIKNLQWLETLTNGPSQKTFTLQKKVKPEPTVNYVYNDHGKLSFDFSFQPVDAPFFPSLQKISQKKLHLPESAGVASVNTKEEYLHGILTGSNRVVLEKNTIYKNPLFSRTYVWTWQEQKSSWKNNHQAHVTLKMVRLEKKE